MKVAMLSQISSIFFALFLGVLFCISIICCEETEKFTTVPVRDHIFNDFITARMVHLTAIQETLKVDNAVRKHTLILDLSKEIINAVYETRKDLPDAQVLVSLKDMTSLQDKNVKKVFHYLENTAFFCDLLTFFPEVIFKVFEENLLWRVTLIDAIQFAISLNINFVDENTMQQYGKAYKMLTEGYNREALTEELRASGRQEEVKEVKKPKRKPRLTLNEF